MEHHRLLDKSKMAWLKMVNGEAKRREKFFGTTPGSAPLTLFWKAFRELLSFQVFQFQPKFGPFFNKQRHCWRNWGSNWSVLSLKDFALHISRWFLVALFRCFFDALNWSLSLSPDGGTNKRKSNRQIIMNGWLKIKIKSEWGWPADVRSDIRSICLNFTARFGRFWKKILIAKENWNKLQPLRELREIF